MTTTFCNIEPCRVKLPSEGSYPFRFEYNLEILQELINDDTWWEVEDMLTYMNLLDRDMLRVSLPPAIAVITWFMVAVGDLSSFDGRN